MSQLALQHAKLDSSTLDMNSLPVPYQSNAIVGACLGIPSLSNQEQTFVEIFSSSIDAGDYVRRKRVRKNTTMTVYEGILKDRLILDFS
jgi:hypothetical protein